mmetsp:Transcript_3886/g.12814  ORF Transcript_3886/g.12814 Transcript_3886/m.12814 type:complete len:517 (-) Transcript_3886:595-2145(-)
MERSGQLALASAPVRVHPFDAMAAGARGSAVAGAGSGARGEGHATRDGAVGVSDRTARANAAGTTNPGSGSAIAAATSAAAHGLAACTAAAASSISVFPAAPSVSAASVTPSASVTLPAPSVAAAPAAPPKFVSAAQKCVDEALTDGLLRRVCFFRGICSEVRLTKHLKRELHGSVVRDFAGGAYEVALALSSGETPRFHVPEMRVRLEWEAERGAYRLSFLSGAEVTLSHGVDAVALSAAAGWYARLRRAQAAVAPPAEELLRAAHEELLRLRRALDRSEEALRNARLEGLAAELLCSVLPAGQPTDTPAAGSAWAEGSAAVAHAPPVAQAGTAASPRRGAYASLGSTGSGGRKIPGSPSASTQVSGSSASSSSAGASLAGAAELTAAHRLAYQSTCARLASSAMESQQRAQALQAQLAALLAGDGRPDVAEALEACQRLCAHTAGAAAEGAAAAQAVMALASEAAGQAGEQPAAGASWRAASGRAEGPDGYRLGDGARTAMRWIGNRRAAPSQP